MTARLRGVAARYGRIADPYRAYWAPVLVSLAGPLLDELAVAPTARVLDVGCGVGTIAAEMRARYGAEVYGIDATTGMLAFARAAGFRVAAADGALLPLRDACIDAAVCTFVLQHVPRPGRVFADVARVLRPGARFGTATWGAGGEACDATKEVDELLRAAHVPADPLAAARSWHHLVDREAAVRRYARRAGLRVERVWCEDGTFRFSRAGMLGWMLRMGPVMRRLELLEARRREMIAAAIADRIRALPASAFRYRASVVYGIAVR